MTDRIFSFIESKNLTPTEFADAIGISRAAISSIKTGRTQPTLMLVEKIKEHFPEINIDWLIFGNGNMLLTDDSIVALKNKNENVYEKDLFQQPGLELNIETEKLSHNDDIDTKNINNNIDNMKKTNDFNSVDGDNNLGKGDNRRKLDKVILLYNDGSFDEFNR